jgi:hypothetical protein
MSGDAGPVAIDFIDDDFVPPGTFHYDDLYLLDAGTT